MAKDTFGSKVETVVNEEINPVVEEVVEVPKVVNQENAPEKAVSQCVFVSDGVYKYV